MEDKGAGAGEVSAQGPLHRRPAWCLEPRLQPRVPGPADHPTARANVLTRPRAGAAGIRRGLGKRMEPATC